jgi:transcriptional regulator with XRE-family HTH domain
MRRRRVILRSAAEQKAIETSFQILRIKAGNLSQEALAAALNIDRQRYRKIEHGLREPTAEELRGLARHLQTSVAKLRYLLRSASSAEVVETP